MARVKLHGLRAVNKRTRAARDLLAWRKRLEADLGGQLTAQQGALVDIATRTRLMLEHVDAYLLEQDSIVNRRHRRLLPIVRERMALADQLARVLGQLGLDGPAEQAPSLSDYLTRARRGQAAPAAPPPAATPAASPIAPPAPASAAAPPSEEDAR